MRGGDPDTGRGVHGLAQVAGKLAQRVVKHGDGLRRERQPRVGVTDDGANGHDPYALPLRRRGEQKRCARI